MAKKTNKQILNNFFALLDNGDVRRISLTTDVIPEIQQIFTDGAAKFIGENIRQVDFDGSYQADVDECLFVEMTLPPAIADAVKSPLSTSIFLMRKEKAKSLFWYDVEKKAYYFQNFDSRQVLTHKFVLFSKDTTYSKLIEDNAFILENGVDAVYSDGKFYFINYPNANKVFSLASFFKEATASEIKTFATDKHVSLDAEWLVKKANSAIKKQITQLTKSGVLDKVSTNTIKITAETLGVTIKLDADNKIVFPPEIKQCRELLEFLNEGRFKGVLTGDLFATNSKRKVTLPPAKA